MTEITSFLRGNINTLNSVKGPAYSLDNAITAAGTPAVAEFHHNMISVGVVLALRNVSRCSIDVVLM